MKLVLIALLLGCGVAGAQLTASSSNEEFLETARKYYARQAELEKLAAEVMAKQTAAVINDPNLSKETKAEILQESYKFQLQAAKDREVKQIEEDKLAALRQIELNQRKQLEADKEAAKKQLDATEAIWLQLQQNPSPVVVIRDSGIVDIQSPRKSGSIKLSRE